MLTKKQTKELDDFFEIVYAKIIFSRKFPKFIYHYTSFDAVISILRSGKLRATDVRFLNDINEYQHGRSMFVDRLRRLSRDGKHPSKQKFASFLVEMLAQRERCVPAQKFVFCLSEKDDDLSQWRAYGGNGGGVCIRFDTYELFKPLNRIEATFGPALYDSKQKAALLAAVISWGSERFEKFDHDPKSRHLSERTAFWSGYYSAGIERYLPLFKNEAFRDEKEWRFVVPLTNIKNLEFVSRNSDLVPYREINASKTVKISKFQHRTLVDWEVLSQNEKVTSKVLPISAIRIGPNNNAQKQAKALEQAFLRYGYWDTEILMSKVPYRT